jgi:hypothetical protein
MHDVLENRDNPTRKAYLRTLLGAAEVGPDKVRIVGSRDVLYAAANGHGCSDQTRAHQASVTTSSHADAPRGMEFLYSANRLNVATSRAKALCIMLANPDVFEPECRTPRQMQLANGFCRYLEMADTL